MRSRKDLPALPPSKAVRPGSEEHEARRSTTNGPAARVVAGAPPKHASGAGRSVATFVLGVLAGAVAVWLAIGDGMSDVYRLRVWAAGELRAMHARSAPVEPPAPSNLPAAPAAPAAPAPTIPIPTVDVERLPRALPRSMATATPPSFAPTSPGAPLLPRAPGPR